MISTLGYYAPHSPSGSKTRFSTGVPSPLLPQSSLFVSSRRPSIPLSPGLLPLLSFPPASQSQSGITGFGCAPVMPSPVHQLPAEILCDIFSYCEAQSQSRLLGPKVTISHVCRRWRSVILCMPLLWAYIHVRNPVESTVNRASTYLGRSGSCPISLSITSDTNLSAYPPYEINAIWSLIQSQAYRLKSLRLMLHGTAQSLVQYAVGSKFPLLDSLDIQLRDCPSTVLNELIFVLRQGSPISSLVWKGGDFPASVAWNHLTRLDLIGVQASETICCILRQCRGLHALCLDTISDTEPLPLGDEIYLPKLHTITLYSLVSLTEFYRQLNVPSLRNMFICYRLSPDTPRDWNAFGDMLNRSCSMLETLTYSDALIKDRELIQYIHLPALAHLKALHIQQPPTTDIILHALSDGSEAELSPCLMPSLESISLARCRSSDGALKSFLLPRTTHGLQEGPTLLRHIKVGLEGSHGEDLNFLQSLRGKSVEVTVCNK